MYNKKDQKYFYNFSSTLPLKLRSQATHVQRRRPGTPVTLRARATKLDDEAPLDGFIFLLFLRICYYKGWNASVATNHMAGEIWVEWMVVKLARKPSSWLFPHENFLSSSDSYFTLLSHAHPLEGHAFPCSIGYHLYTSSKSQTFFRKLSPKVKESHALKHPKCNTLIWHAEGNKSNW